VLNSNFFKKLPILLFFYLLLFSCKDIESEKKIDPGLRLHLKNQKTASQLNQPITIVFKVNEELSDLHIQVLRRKKVKIIANIGHIYTASLPKKTILALAKFKFVDYIQGSKKLKTTSKDTTEIPIIKEF